MKKATRRLLGAVFALVVAVAVSVGATFAWFTTSDTAKVTGIDATVTTGDASLEVREIGADGLPISDYAYSIKLDADTVANVVLFDLSSDDEGETLQDANGTDVTYGTYFTSSSPKSATNKAKYLEFFLEFRSTSEKYIVLDDTSTVTGENAVDEKGNEALGPIRAWTDLDAANYGVAVSALEQIDAKAENAVRVSFTQMEYTDTTTSGSEDYTLKVADGADTVHVWDPHEGEGFQYDYEENYITVSGGQDSAPVTKTGHVNLAEQYELYLLGEAPEDYVAGTTQPSTDGNSNDAAKDYAYLVKQVTDKYENPDYTKFEAGKEGANDSTFALEQNGTSTYYHQIIRVRIWIEGTDSECINNLFSDTISAVLNFTLGEDVDSD